MPIRDHVLLETNFRRIAERPPRVAVLPWGATEAHNLHLPYGADVLLAVRYAEAAACEANRHGAASIVLPVIPYGNDEQQLDQFCTVSITTTTAVALLRAGLSEEDVAKVMGGNVARVLGQALP